MQTATKPNWRTQPPTATPKPSATARELSVEEKAALWDEAEAYHNQGLALQAEIDRLRFRQQSLKGKHDALFERGASKTVAVGPCTTCQYDICQCERLV